VRGVGLEDEHRLLIVTATEVEVIGLEVVPSGSRSCRRAAWWDRVRCLVVGGAMLEDEHHLSGLGPPPPLCS
jgi:hypothetical protein